jgi:hypothetical protein
MPRTVSNPSTGAPMFVQSALSKRDIIRAMMQQGKSAAYATQFAEPFTRRKPSSGRSRPTRPPATRSA